MAKSAKAIKRSEGYFQNLDKANKLYWEACNDGSGLELFNVTFTSSDDTSEVELDI